MQVGLISPSLLLGLYLGRWCGVWYFLQTVGEKELDRKHFLRRINFLTTDMTHMAVKTYENFKPFECFRMYFRIYVTSFCHSPEKISLNLPLNSVNKMLSLDCVLLIIFFNFWERLNILTFWSIDSCVHTKMRRYFQSITSKNRRIISSSCSEKSSNRFLFVKNMKYFYFILDESEFSLFLPNKKQC